jgi:Flp pilus assembly pilin Flp
MRARLERFVRRLVAPERVQIFMEYAWLGVLIALVCLISVAVIGNTVDHRWTDVSNQLP